MAGLQKSFTRANFSSRLTVLGDSLITASRKFALKIFDRARSFFKEAARGGRRGCFGVEAQHRFGAGGPSHQPAHVANVDFDAVEVLAIHDGPVEPAVELGVGEVFYSAALLAIAKFEIDAAVMMLAIFGVKKFDEFAEGFAMPGHDFGE